MTAVLDGALADAGLKAGDVIVSFRGQPLPESRPLASLWMQVQFQARFDEAVEVGIERDGAARTLKAVWPRK